MNFRLLKTACGLLLASCTASAQSFTQSTVYSFSNSTGSNPVASLTQGPDGNFHSTVMTAAGSSPFALTPSGDFSEINANLGIGEYLPGLLLGPDGNYYGVTSGGPISGPPYIVYGAVFQLTPSGELSILHTFSGGSDGGTPLGGLVEGTDGSLYGTTAYGGILTGNCKSSSGCGTVFKISRSGAFSTL